ncbi:hypothetical protein Tco_0995158 [Tanacetum coccineum]
MEGKSFEEGLAEITETLKRLQSTLLFHQTKLKESFRQARQDFSLARRDISLATEKLHRSIKAAIKEEVDHEEQFDFLGVQLNQRIPNRTVKARKVKARLFWRKFIVTIDRTRRPKSIQSVVMLRLGHHHPSVARGNIRVLGLNVQRVRQHPPRLVYQVCYWPILHYKGNQRQIWDPGITWLKISKEHLEDKVANNQTFEELLKAIKEVTLMVRNLSATVDGSLQVMKEPVTEAPCYDDLGRLYSTKSGVAREKKKVVEETTFHESNKLDLGLGSGAYGEDGNYHEFMDDSVVEEIYIASPVMVVAEDLGQKRIHDFDDTTMVLGSPHKREKSEKIMTDEHKRGIKLVEILEDKTDCKQPGLSNSIKWAMIGCRHQSHVAGWGLKVDQILEYPKPFIEGFRLSLQCLLPRRTWDPGITWLKILKEHLEDKARAIEKKVRKMEFGTKFGMAPDSVEW